MGKSTGIFDGYLDKQAIAQSNAVSPTVAPPVVAPPREANEEFLLGHGLRKLFETYAAMLTKKAALEKQGDRWTDLALAMTLVSPVIAPATMIPRRLMGKTPWPVDEPEAPPIPPPPPPNTAAAAAADDKKYSQLAPWIVAGGGLAVGVPVLFHLVDQYKKQQQRRTTPSPTEFAAENR